MIKTNQKGITLISLIITIIVMLILASVTIHIGTGSIDNSRMMSFVTYMQTIQAKVDFIAQYDNYLNYGEELSDIDKSALQNILNSETEELVTTTSSIYLRYFDSSHIASDLEVDNIDDEIVVDFNTREVISLNGIEYKDETYYTQYNLPGGQVLKQYQSIDRTDDVKFNTITTKVDGLNATFTIESVGITNGTLSYGRKDSEGNFKWTTITNYTTKGQSVTTKNITESGTYYFKLVDNITGQDNGAADAKGNITYPSVELRLTNSPKLEGNLTDLSTSYNYSNLNDSTKWAFATDSTDPTKLKYYVWIPRYAYKVDSERNIIEDEDENVILEFLRGTSDITSSGGYISSVEDSDGNKWVVPDEFTDGGNLKTGVWIQVDSPNQTRHRHNRHTNNRNDTINDV